jgi:hypothetical protein
VHSPYPQHHSSWWNQKSWWADLPISIHSYLATANKFS